MKKIEYIVAISLVLFTGIAVSAQEVAPALSTDKLDYLPGETVTISGVNFLASQDIVLTISGGSVEEGNYTESSQSVIADETGSFTATYILDSVYRPVYTVVAATSSGEVLATTTFTDPIVVDFRQCANEDPTLGDCHWINSIIQQSNSMYYEGMSVPQRVVFTNIPATTDNVHTLTLSHQATKGGIHAYDWLTSYSQAINTAVDVGIPYTDLYGQTCDAEIGPPGSLGTTCEALRTGTYCVNVNVPDDGFISKDGTTQDKINAYESAYGNRTIRICGNSSPITSASLSLVGHTVANGEDTGDSYIDYELSWTSSSTEILIKLAGHLAVDGDGTGYSWGPDLGSSSISGGPYHFKLSHLDGSSLGSQDNQIKGADILAPQEGNIVVAKETVPDGDQTLFTFNPSWGSSFQLSDGQSSDSGPLTAGTYSVSETALAGWVLTDTTCVSSIGDTETAGSLELDPEETITCTFTNSKLPTLTLEKTVVNNNGGTATEDDFQAKIDNNNVPWDAAQTLSVGSHTASEVELLGYSASAWGEDCAADGSVTLAYGDNKTCTITNDDQQAYITVVKVVTNDNGGSALPDDFLLTLEGGSATSGVAVPVNPGTYTAAETLLSGYTFEGFSGDCDSNGDTTVALGESKTCILTNNDNAPKLIVIKHVINDDGGTAVASDFTINVTDTDVSPSTFPGQESPGTEVDLWAGTYSVTEDGVTGYAGSYSADCSGTIALGETKTCTITNDDIAPKLTLVKTVINDNGGTAVVADFPLFISGTPATSGVAYEQTANVQLTASETSQAGYTPSVWGEDCAAGGTITLLPGDNKTCTITNDDQQAYITVVKVVINDNGGSADPDDFLLTLEGGSATSGVAVPVNPGTYTAAETLLSGYTFEGFSGNCDSNGDTTVALGESKTCTLTNDDQTGHLIVHKITIPADNPNVFSITLSSAPASGSATRDLSTVADVDYEVNAGTYSVTEAAEAGWDETGNTCEDVVVANGETEECTITNTQRGHIIIIKDVIGNPDPTDFTFHNNFGNSNPDTFLLDEDNDGTLPSSRDFEVLTGTYFVSEDPVTNWQSPESTSCTNGETVDSIDVAPGETVTCTFVNEELVEIILVKNTIGGDASFDFDGTGAGLPTDIDLTTVGGTASQTFTGLDQDNTYSIAENVPAGWALTGAVCTGGNTPASITPDPGETVTCTFTNNKPAAQIDVDPLQDTNAVGQNHVITAAVLVHNGDGSWGPAANGTLVTFTLLNNTASASFVGGDTCLTSGGSCSVTINAVQTGSVDIHASAAPVVLGVTLNVATGTGGDNSADAGKDYVNARISITPDEYTNEVGNEHEFTVTVEQDTGLGWVPVESAVVDVDVTPAPDSLDESDCADGTDASGQCVATINSSSADVYTANASTTIEVNGVQFVLLTNGIAPNSGPATKTYVDAKINLTPLTGTNNINVAHTITATVMEDPGTGPVAAGSELVTFSLLNNTAGATFVGGNTCTTNGSGQCSVQINSATPGSVDIHATVDVSVGGLILTRATDSTHGSSQDANKVYIAGKIIVQKVTVGGDAEFNFNADYKADFQLSNAEEDNSGWIPTGSHTISEDVLPGWELTSIVCSGAIPGIPSAWLTNFDPAYPVELELDPNETITCVFTNTKLGKITIVKDAQPNDCKDFSFSGTLGTFLLDDDQGVTECIIDPVNQPQSKTFENLAVNTSYAVNETVPAYWTLKGPIVCTGSSDYSQITNGISINLKPGEEVTCTFVNEKPSPTRTQGFWQTHTSYTSLIFSTYFGSGMQIGTTPHKGLITNTQSAGASQLFGAFYSSIPKTSTGARRNALDKARMQLLQQLVAAKLNCAAFGCTASVQTMIANADTAYAGTNVNAILSAAGQLDVYNNSGDTLIISGQGKATPKTSQSWADIPYWNQP